MNNHVVDGTASKQSDLGGQYCGLTSTFVHNNPLHLLGNLFFLWILGKRLELRDGAGNALSHLKRFDRCRFVVADVKHGI
jgi:hypothetical protein